MDIGEALLFNILYFTGGDLYGIGDNIGWALAANKGLTNKYGDFVGSEIGLIDALSPKSGPPVPTYSSMFTGGTDGLSFDKRIATTKEDMQVSNKKHCIFGLWLLPWDAEVLPSHDSPPVYYFISTGLNDEGQIRKKFNPLRSETLLMKAQTIAIFVIGALIPLRWI